MYHPLSSWQRVHTLLVLCVAAATLAVTLPAMAEESVATDEGTVAEVVGAGDLVKSPEFASVYYIGEDGERYAFPNENIYFSWYEDYGDVVTISPEDLAQYTLGGNVDYQAGTSLVKLESDPTVYCVEPEGVLRAIDSEEQASKLYGEDWAEEVDDLSAGFWNSYDVGDALEDDELPDGYVTYDDDSGAYYYVVDGALTLMSDDALAQAEHLKNFATPKHEVGALHEELTDLFASADELSAEEFVTRAMTVFVPEDMRSNVAPSFALSDEAILKIYAEMIATWEEYAKTYAEQYTDTDMDGMSDDMEIQQGTDPDDADTDDDGFPDGVEVARGFNPGYVDSNESDSDGEGSSRWWEDENAWWQEWSDEDISEDTGNWYATEMTWTKEDGSVWSTSDSGNTWTSDSGETWDWEMSEDVWVNSEDASIQWEWENEYAWVHEDGSAWYSEDRENWEDWDGYSWVEGDDGWETEDNAKQWDEMSGYTWEVGDGIVWTSDDGGKTWESTTGEVWSYDPSQENYATEDGYEWSGDEGTTFEYDDYESYQDYRSDNPTADYTDYYQESPDSSTSGSSEAWEYDGDSGTWKSESGQTWSDDSGTSWSGDSSTTWSGDSGTSSDSWSSDGSSSSGGDSGGSSSGGGDSSGGSTSTM